MSKPRGGLGRGLAALIPTGPQTNVVSDVFMGGSSRRIPTPPEDQTTNLRPPRTARPARRQGRTAQGPKSMDAADEAEDVLNPPAPKTGRREPERNAERGTEPRTRTSRPQLPG